MTSYVVSAYDTKAKTWKTVLSTQNEAEALAMKEAINARTRIPAGQSGCACTGPPNDSNDAALFGPPILEDS